MIGKLLNSLFFLLLLTWGGLIFIFEPTEYSALEKRDLKKLPELSVSQFINKKYADSLDAYLADHFIGRDWFVAASFFIKKQRGYQSEELGFIEMDADFDLGAVETNNADTSQQAANSQNDSLLYQNDGQAEDVGQLHRKLLIYNRKAIEIFGGENKTGYGMSTEYCAKVASQYADSLAATTQIYLAIAPSSGELLLPTEYKNNLNDSRNQRYCIQTAYNYLSPKVKAVDICSELHLHKNEYLYFGTDHHWTGRGAYYGYVAFCKQAKLIPLNLDSMERKVIPNFLGSLYRLTRDSRLANNPDSVEYFKIPQFKMAAYSMEGANYQQKVKKQVWAEIAKGENSYGVFLSRDYALMSIETNVPTERVALIIKNSYGNPFTTFLTANFKQILAVDYRKFQGNIIDLVRKHKVTDLIICQGAFAANTASHTQMIQKMLTAPLKVPFISRDTSLMR